MVHIIVPMSGTGERFKRAGYAEIKPLIKVDGKPIIEHVVSMFSAEDRFTFVCNEDHLNETDLFEILEEINPTATIISIEPHKKGPVYAVSQCLDLIEEDEETIVNYCDFYSYWNYSDFLSHTRNRSAAGAIPAYRNFHPHMLGTDNYAFMRAENQWLLAIQEKKPFTSNRMSEFASNGTYYFAAGKYVKKYFLELLESQSDINGEFYVSMVYNLMVKDGLPISIYEVQHMLQWGTPADLEQYQLWSEYFRKLSEIEMSELAKEAHDLVDICLIPMAGKGSRFADVGYQRPKPLIPVSGKPMVVQATSTLPAADRYIFVALNEHLIQNDELRDALQSCGKKVSIVELDHVTEGQAITCQFGLTNAKPPVLKQNSLLIGACDNGIVFNQSKFNKLLNDATIDCAAFSFRNHPSSERNPQMYGWLNVDDAESEFPKVKSVSVKVPISENPQRDHAIVGAFYFRRVEDFNDALAILQAKNIRVNNEFYVDSMVGVLAESGRRCVAFEVKDYICFGTPNDLKTFEYWQSFFHKCDWHPYRIELDPFADARNEELQQTVTHATRQESIDR